MILEFWKIMETNQVEKLDRDFKPGKKYTHEQLLSLEKQWMKLYDEFFSLRNNKHGVHMMTKNLELKHLSLKLDMLYDIENRIILLIEMVKTPEFNDFVNKRTVLAIADFKKLYPKVKLGNLVSTFEVLDIVQQVIKSQTNIYDEKTGAISNGVEKQVKSIYSIVSQMGVILGFNLNVQTMTCAEFIGHEETVEQKAKQNNDSGPKNKK